MNGSCTAIVAFVTRSVAPAALVATFLWSSPAHSRPLDPPTNERPAAAPQTVQVSGRVVDAQTGKPIEAFITQAGKFDPKAPNNVTWGFSESRTTSGHFSATIRWNDGWTARILADGYIPQPLLVEAPLAGNDQIDTVIRLKRGRTVRGRVLDHLGNPVRGASVFAVRSIGLTLADGQAVNSYDGEKDPTVRGAKTDPEGRFELAVGDPAGQGRPAGDRTASGGNVGPASGRAPGLAVSSPALDAWPAPLPDGDAEAIIRLPSPTRVGIRFDIEGSDAEASVFLQSVMLPVEEWKGIEVIRRLPIRNRGRVDLTSLPPGRYQFARSRMLRHGSVGQGLFLDQQFVEVVSDKATTVSFVRPTGARLHGSVEWDERTRLTGVIVSVRKVASPDDPRRERESPPVLDARLLRVPSDGGPGERLTLVGHRGLFLTERIPPGTYEVLAEGYAPLTPEQERRTGFIGPALTARSTVMVPGSGVVPSLKMELKSPAPQGIGSGWLGAIVQGSSAIPGW